MVDLVPGIDDDTPASEVVPVPRGDLTRVLHVLTAGLILGALALAVYALVWNKQRETNDHLGETDEVLVAFVRAELAEEEREQAAACIDTHERYAEFEDLAAGLTEAGAVVAAEAYVNLADADPGTLAAAEQEIAELLPERVAPLLERYPPPSCDLEVSARIMAQPVPEPPDIDSLVR
jgi:hypothetical protein